MKILIAYDGSESADAALADLKRAGLDIEADVLVMCVADVFVPPPMDEVNDTFPMYVPESVKHAHERAQHKLKATGTRCVRSLNRRQKDFALRDYMRKS